VTNLSSGEKFLVNNSQADGEYSVVLTAGSKYEILFDHANFLPDTLKMDLQNQKSFLLERKNIVLKSSWSASIDIVDKDLHNRLNAWLHVQQQGNDLYNDSIKIEQLPFAFNFEVNKDYNISASQKKYADEKVNYLFKDMKYAKNKNVKIQLEHEKVEFMVNIVNASNKQKMKVKVHAHNKNEDETIIAEAGQKMLLRKGDHYQIVSESEAGYFFSSKEIIADETQTASIDLYVLPIEVGGKLSLNNILFETNSAQLKGTSQFELDCVIGLMKANPNVVVEVSAHTDDVGDQDYNLKLSEKRAQSAWEYLIEKGVDKQQLFPKGYGESQPLLPNESEENRAQNRRVELKVLKMN
jgi:outer membrane protein OmpA-like peptidoglycan-associated protein